MTTAKHRGQWRRARALGLEGRVFRVVEGVELTFADLHVLSKGVVTLDEFIAARRLERTPALTAEQEAAQATEFWAQLGVVDPIVPTGTSGEGT